MVAQRHESKGYSTYRAEGVELYRQGPWPMGPLTRLHVPTAPSIHISPAHSIHELLYLRVSRF